MPKSLFFYGVFVKLAHLCFACDSYKSNNESLLAIDLICSRRRKGHLSTGGTSQGILSMPQELWDKIKSVVIDMGMIEAEESLLEEYSEGAEEKGIAGPRSWDSLGFWDDDSREFVSSCGASGMLEARQEALPDLINSFGLFSPFPETPYTKQQQPENDHAAFHVISLPPKNNGIASTSGPSPIAMHSSSVLQTPTQDSLKLPFDADRRITRFLSLFRLESMDPRAIDYPHIRSRQPFIVKPPRLMAAAIKKRELEARQKSKNSLGIEPEWYCAVCLD
ncbi:hypothetical protein JCM5353_006263 [Sporobolomyces roseus]